MLPLSLLFLPLFSSAAAFEEIYSASGYNFSAGLSAFVSPPAAPVSFPSAVIDKAAASGHYLTPSELDLSAVPAAPADGSAADKKDFETLLAWQAGRTGAQCSLAQSETEHSFEVFFGKITPFAVPQPDAVKKFFSHVGKDSVAAHTYLKGIYKRERPFVRDARIKPCVMRPRGLAYPSGHATMSRLFALILGDLVPSRRKAFIARADEAALNRVIAGVHHPTDIEAGRLLANELYRNLLEDEAFVSDMESMRAYLR